MFSKIVFCVSKGALCFLPVHWVFEKGIMISKLCYASMNAVNSLVHHESISCVLKVYCASSDGF